MLILSIPLYLAVIPDAAFGVLLKNRFGREAHVTRKYRRMLYWLPKFKNINPYPIPPELPLDPRQLALIALRRMSVDRETQYNIFEVRFPQHSPFLHYVTKLVSLILL